MHALGGEVSNEGTETKSSAATLAVQDVCGGGEAVTGTLKRSAELQSDATEIEHNKSSEWADTIPQSADRTRLVQQLVAVELSVASEDTHSPDTEAADAPSERHEHLTEAQPDLNQG